ncbi:MAG: hypothetical protein ACRDD8_05910 [Bacteroidales bacterium]
MIKKNPSDYEKCGGSTIMEETIIMEPTLAPSNMVSASSKFIYIMLKYHSDKNKMFGSDFSPSYSFVNKKYGISTGTYRQALKELSEIGAIKYTVTTVNKKSYLNISVIQKNEDYFEFIPNILIFTRCLTYQQKLFIILLWKWMNKKVGDSNMLISRFIITDIITRLEKIGISKRTAYRHLSELSNPDSGYVNLLSKTDDGYYMFNLVSLLELYEMENSLMEYYGETTQTRTYVKPKEGDFYTCKESGKLKARVFNY